MSRYIAGYKDGEEEQLVGGGWIDGIYGIFSGLVCWFAYIHGCLKVNSFKHHGIDRHIVQLDTIIIEDYGP